MKRAVFQRCRRVFPAWSGRSIDDFDFDDPKGFSSFTMGVRARVPVEPPAVLYRQLAGKENAILDFDTERSVFLLLGEKGIAARCFHYDRDFRIEAFYFGRTLQPADLMEKDTLRQIAGQLFRFHQLTPDKLPAAGFFDLMHRKWGELARTVIGDHSAGFPQNERDMARDLREIYQPETLEKVRRLLPPGPMNFCHNDTYHGNIMKLDSGEIRLLDFEFSCLNHKTYDFSNLFAETVMQHQLPDYPYFRIAEPEYGDRELGWLIDGYLDHQKFASARARANEFGQLMEQTRKMIVLSDFKYAMAALPLALDPIQKIRFIPYAHQRFTRFLDACEKMNL